MIDGVFNEHGGCDSQSAVYCLTTFELFSVDGENKELCKVFEDHFRVYKKRTTSFA